MRFSTFGLLFTSLIFTSVILSCSSTGKLTDSNGDGNYPQWYQASGFSVDSSAYSGYATAIAADSSAAISRAEKQARAQLESRIAEKLENVRQELEESGSTNAASADFILTLRNAHNSVEKEADLAEGEAKSGETHFRGFAQVTITRDDLMSVLESGFSGKSSYWNELRSAESFSQEFESAAVN